MGLGHKGQEHNEQVSAGALVDPSMKPATADSSTKGSSMLDSTLASALDDRLGSALASGQAVKAKDAKRTGVAFDEAGDMIDDMNHGGSKVGGPRESVSALGNSRISLDGLRSRMSDSTTVEQSTAAKILDRARFTRGDLIDTGAGANDVAIGGKGSDTFFGDGGGTNTFTTGTGVDSIILGKGTTNRVFDFDPTKDRLLLGNGLTMKDVMVVQGTNPGKGGVNQPLDSVNNTLVVSKADGRILASLTFVKADKLTATNFRTISDTEVASLRKNENIAGFGLMKGAGTITSDGGSNNIKGSSGNDFVRLGGDQVRFNTIRADSGAGEFPFPNPSLGSSQVNIKLQGSVLSLAGNYKNFEATPLFSQGEKAIDPNAIILNGSDPVALINGFLATPQDAEGNKITGTHVHFSPAEDDRGNFADATIVRYINNTVTSATTGNIAGQFKLKPEEEAALIAGNLYFNLHTNVDIAKDGKAGFPTGENRLNVNHNIVQFV